MKEISVQELKAMRDAQEDFQLIDVREAYERDICSIDGEHIPMGDIMQHTDKIRKDVKVVVHCRSGGRSGAVINALETNFQLDNLYNLTGGILAWAAEIDTSLEQY